MEDSTYLMCTLPTWRVLKMLISVGNVGRQEDLGGSCMGMER